MALPPARSVCNMGIFYTRPINVPHLAPGRHAYSTCSVRPQALVNGVVEKRRTTQHVARERHQPGDVLSLPRLLTALNGNGSFATDGASQAHTL